jgi:hypothetical protein
MVIFVPLSQTWERGWGEGIKFWNLHPKPIAPLTPQFWGELKIIDQLILLIT